MTGVKAVGRQRWAAIGAGLVLAGCGSAAAAGLAPNTHAVQPDGTQRCTEVYCITQGVPRGRATFTANG